MLRAEKGYVIVGQETDGSVTPLDLGLGALIKPEGDFLGRRSLARRDTARPDRKQLVGLLPDDPEEVIPEGAQLVAELGGTPPVPMIGHVTSSYYGRAARPQLCAGAGRGRTLAARRAGLGAAARPHRRRADLPAGVLRHRRTPPRWLSAGAGAHSPLEGVLPWSLPDGRSRCPNCAFAEQIGVRVKPPVPAYLAGVPLPMHAEPGRRDARVAHAVARPRRMAGDGAARRRAGSDRPLDPGARRAARTVVTDLSASRAVIEIAGAHARTLLQKGCGLDLHPREFGPGQCAQTLFAKLPVIIDQLARRPGLPAVRAPLRRALARRMADRRGPGVPLRAMIGQSDCRIGKLAYRLPSLRSATLRCWIGDCRCGEPAG